MILSPLAPLLLSLTLAASAGAPIREIAADEWTEKEAADGWAEKTLRVTPSGSDDPGLELSGLLEPFEIQVDGEVVRPLGPELGLHGGWHRFLATLRAGRENTIIVRERADSRSDFQREGVYLGDRVALVTAATRTHLPRAAFAVTCLMLGLSALMVFALRREEKLYLCFAVFAIAEAAVLFASGGLHELLWELAGPLDHVRLWARALGPPALVMFFAKATSHRTALFERATNLATAVGLGLLGVDLLSGGATHLALVIWNNLLFLAASGAVLFILAGALRSSLRDYGPPAVAMVLVLGSGVLEASRVLPVVLSATAVSLAYLALLLTMGELLLRRWANVFTALHEEVRARDEFLSVVSHELRNPLAAMLAGADLLWRQSPSSESRQHVEMIRRQGKVLTRLMDDLLDLGRIRAGRLKVELHPLAVSSALRGALEGMRHVADAKGVALELTPPVDGLAVEADPARLEQMITNLLRNAIQHTPSGGKVSLRAEAGADEARVRITVADTGRGIAPEALQRLLRPSAAVAAPTPSSPPDGLGVGLALVRRLAQLHGGQVSARSGGANQGSEFTLELRRAALPAPAAPRPAPAQAPELSPLPTPVQSDRRVLVIDDNANLRLSMRLLLEHCGYRVQEAADGRSGLETLLTGAFDAAVVDLRMPEIDGLEVARRIRAQPEGSKLRLVALTGMARPEDRESARAAGFDHVLFKPADPDQLAAALR